jgi:hypothetical protein
VQLVAHPPFLSDYLKAELIILVICVMMFVDKNVGDKEGEM